MAYIPLQIPQDSLSTYSFEETADTAQVRPAPKPRTVKEILRLLPPDATPAQQDSLVQAMMDIPEPTQLSTRPDTLYLPGLKGSPADVNVMQLNPNDNYFSDKDYFHAEQKVTQIGMAAEPLTYRLNNDDYVTGLLLLSFFMAALFIARNIRILAERVKNFFHWRADEEFSPGTNSEIRGQAFLVLQTCLTIAILFFDYTQQHLTEVFNQISPYILLGMYTGICLAYFAGKIIVYRFVNWVFFERLQNRRWMEAYLLTITFMGLSLFIVALLVVYFDLAFNTLKIVALLLVATFKVLQLIKCKQIFFSYTLSYVHLFLYFCTLELIPALLLWKAMVYFSEILIVNI